MGKGMEGTSDQSFSMIKQAVCLRPKMYSLDLTMVNTTQNVESDLSIRRAKGVSRRTVTKSIRHENYLNCLRTGMPQRHQMTCIRSMEQKLYIVNITKKSLSFCTKRYFYSMSHSWPLRNSTQSGSLKKVQFYEDRDIFDNLDDSSDVQLV